VTTYAFPTNNQTARGASSAPFNGAFVVPDWRRPQLAAYNPSTSGISISGFAGIPITGSVDAAVQISDFLSFTEFLGDESFDWAGATLTGSYLDLVNDTTTEYSSASGLATGWVADAAIQETGYVACSSGSASLWALGYGEGLLSYSVSGTITQWALPFGETFCGIVLQNDVPYFLNTAGQLYTIYQGITTLVQGAFPDNSGTVLPALLPANLSGFYNTMQEQGGTLYAMSPSTQSVIPYALSTAISGASGSAITTPMTLPYTLSTGASGTSGLIGVVGTNQTVVGISANALTYLPLLSELFAAQTSANLIQVLQKNSINDWTVSQTVSGAGSPSFLAVLTNAEQLLVSNTANNVLQVIPETDGVWGSGTAQSLSVTDASALAVALDNTTAFVCQPSQNQLGVFASTNGTWASGTPIPVPNPQCVIVANSDTGYCGGVSGITNLVLLNGTWQSSGSITTSFGVSGLAVDTLGGLYATGSNGTSGMLEVYFNGVAVGGATWQGNGAQIAWYEGQILVLDTVNNLVRVFGLIDGQYVLQFAAATVSGATSFVQLQDTWFVGGASLWEYEWNSPYQFVPSNTGIAAIYTIPSGTWATYALGRGERPFSSTFDSSGNLWVISDANQLYAIDPAGTLVSSNTVPVYTGQHQTTPLGISSLNWWNGVLYGSSCLNDAIAVGL